MKGFEVVMGDDVVNAFWVFNWDSGVYELLIEKDGKREVLFSGDIEYLKEVLKDVLKEIERNL